MKRPTFTRRAFTLSLTVAAALASSTALYTGRAMAQDELVVVFAEDSNSDALYDPRVSQSRHEKQLFLQVFDTLIAADYDGSLHPGLAESWELSDDATELKMTLKQGVTFHDGTPFDAEAVKFTFDTVVDPATGSQSAVDFLGPYESTEILGPHELIIHFSQPFPSAETALTNYFLAIVSPAAVQEMGNAAFAQAPVGTGPFKFESWDQGAQVTLVRNDDYNWAPGFYEKNGPSAVSKVVHRFIPNAATRVAALEAGEVSVTDLTPPLDMRRLDAADGYDTMSGVVSGVPFSMMMNISRGPLADKALREAMILAVDRQKLAGNLFFGFAEASYGPISSTTPYYWDGVEDYYAYDPDKAVAMLDEAGWAMGADGIREKDGQKASIHYLSMLEPETSVALQAELKKIGVELQIDSVTKARQDELIMTNGYDMGAIRWVSLDPSVLRIPFHSSNISEPGKFKFNWMRVDDPELDALIETSSAAPTKEDQGEAFKALQKYIMDQAYFWPLHDQVQTIAFTDDITGVRFAPGQWQVRLYGIERAE